jgi:hypothetical protein
MTPDDKRDRRAARHSVEKEIKRHVLYRTHQGLTSTSGSIKHSVRILTDRYFKEATSHLVSLSPEASSAGPQAD